MTSIAERRAKLMALAKDDKVMFTPSSKPTPQTTKAKLMALAKDDSIMFTPAPKPKAPTNFLSLPRELRQNILYLSRDLDISYKKDGPVLYGKPLMQYHLLINSLLMQDRAYTVYSRFFDNHTNRRKCESERIAFRMWKDVLLLVEFSGVVATDMSYVFKRWIDNIDRMYKECEDGRYPLYQVKRVKE